MAICIAVGTSAAWAGQNHRSDANASSHAASSSHHKSSAVTGEHSRRAGTHKGHASTSTAAPSSAPTPTAVSTAPVPALAVAPAPTPAPTPTPTPTPAATAAATAAPAATGPAVVGATPTHTNIVATTFWVGEIFNANLSDGSQVCSTYDSQWALHATGMNGGTTPSSASGCPGSVFGGCDGTSTGSGTGFACATEKRDVSNGYFPKSGPKPLQNPFYLDLPYDDVNDSTAFAQRCQVVPWAAADNAATGVNHCGDSSYSYLKNRWVQMTGPSGKVCYGQVEDAGPSSGSLYHDSAYVFGGGNARPVNKDFSGDSSQGAGTDVSPALNGCMGFAELDGDTDHVNWKFVDRANVPAGPWLNVSTTSQVTQ